MRNESKKRNTFTLLELIIVVLIIAILAGLAMPTMQKTIWRARFAEVYTTVGALVK